MMSRCPKREEKRSEKNKNCSFKAPAVWPHCNACFLSLSLLFTNQGYRILLPTSCCRYQHPYGWRKPHPAIPPDDLLGPFFTLFRTLSPLSHLLCPLPPFFPHPAAIPFFSNPVLFLSLPLVNIIAFLSLLHLSGRVSTQNELSHLLSLPLPLEEPHHRAEVTLAIQMSLFGPGSPHRLSPLFFSKPSPLSSARLITLRTGPCLCLWRKWHHQMETPVVQPPQSPLRPSDPPRLRKLPVLPKAKASTFWIPSLTFSENLQYWLSYYSSKTGS